MTPFNLPLTIKKSISFGPVIFNFKQADATPFNLTGWHVFAHARRYKNSKEKIDFAPLITDAANGEVTVAFSDEQTSVLTGGEYGWDLVLEDTTGIRTGPYFAGKVKVTEIYTHS